MLFEGIDLGVLLRDLRSVKMPQRDRARVEALQRAGLRSAADVGEAWALVRRWRKQLEELHAARERARHSLGRKQLGVTRVEVAEAVAQRQRAERVAREDLGL